MQSCEPPAALNVLFWPVVSPKNRVGGSPAFSFVFTFQFIGETVDTPAENGGCGYDFASGVHKYLYAEDDPVNLIDMLGLSAADVTKIYNLYAQKLQAMTDAGQRLNTEGDHTIGWYNNLCGLFGGQELGCGQQAAEVDAVLVFQKYDVHWDFDIPQIFNPLPHQFVKATSADPNDPTLIIDPWAGTFYEKYSDGSGNLLTVPILDKDQENSLPGPVFSAPSAGGFDFGAGDFGFGGIF
jgi:hypothetical protein